MRASEAVRELKLPSNFSPIGPKRKPGWVSCCSARTTWTARCTRCSARVANSNTDNADAHNNLGLAMVQAGLAAAICGQSFRSALRLRLTMRDTARIWEPPAPASKLTSISAIAQFQTALRARPMTPRCTTTWVSRSS